MLACSQNTGVGDEGLLERLEGKTKELYDLYDFKSLPKLPKDSYEQYFEVGSPWICGWEGSPNTLVHGKMKKAAKTSRECENEEYFSGVIASIKLGDDGKPAEVWTWMRDGEEYIQWNYVKEWLVSVNLGNCYPVEYLYEKCKRNTVSQ